MIAAAMHLIAFARSFSAKTWLVGIALIAMLTAAARLVNYGEHREALRVATVARADTIKTDVAALRIALAQQDSAVAHVVAARTAIDLAVIPRAARNLHLASVDSLPPAVVALISADDARITADSVYITSTEVLLHSIVAVESAHATLDSTLIHPVAELSQQALERPAGRYVIAGMLGIGARLCYNLVRHKPVLP